MDPLLQNRCEGVQYLDANRYDVQGVEDLRRAVEGDEGDLLPVVPGVQDLIPILGHGGVGTDRHLPGVRVLGHGQEVAFLGLRQCGE